MAVSAAEERRHQSKIVKPDIDVNSLVNYNPIGCFYLDPIEPRKYHLSFHLASILLSLYGVAPESLTSMVREKLGIEPVKYDINKRIEAAVLFHYRNVLVHICNTCPWVRECPWGNVIKSLRIQ